MKTLLKIDSSLQGERSVSNRLTALFVERWREQNPTARVVERDLSKDPIPHLSAATLEAFSIAKEERTPEQSARAGLSDRLIEELQQADVIVLGLPMYNFSVPSTFKAYIDHITRARVTFRYTESGAEGLLKGKKAFVLGARGGLYAGTDADNQTGWVRQILGFVGISDVELVFAEGLLLGDDARRRALDGAEARVAELATGRMVA